MFHVLSEIDHMASTTPADSRPVKVDVHICVSDDQSPMLPSRRRAPDLLPANVPIPRTGEVVYLSSTSAWLVTSVVHEWLNKHHLRVQVWCDYHGSGRYRPRPDFDLTQ